MACLCKNIVIKILNIIIVDSKFPYIKGNYTPLMIASERGWTEVVKLLIKEGADLEVKNASCWLYTEMHTTN